MNILGMPSAKFDIIKGCAVDYMHAFLQNTVRRFLNYLQDAKLKNKNHMEPRFVWKMSNVWESFKFPVEFCHQTTLNLSKDSHGKLDVWKANQLRQFALYGSDMLIAEFVRAPVLTAWRRLIMAMRILCDSALCLSMNDEAHDLICSAQDILSDEFPMFTQLSFHILRHLPTDCANYNLPAEEFSCFWGENTLRRIKMLIGTMKNPLINVARGLLGHGAVFVPGQNPRYRPRFLQRHPKEQQSTVGFTTFRGVQTKNFRLVGGTPGKGCTDERAEG
jgi:hypothetical protein